MNEENKRPRSYSSRRRYTPSPLPIPPSRRSVPDFFRYNYPDTFRARAPGKLISDFCSSGPSCSELTRLLLNEKNEKM